MVSKKLIAVIKREYIVRLKTKGFIIGTFLFPLILFAIIAGSIVLSMKNIQEPKTIVIIDQTGVMYDEFVKQLSDTLSSGEPLYHFTRQDIAPDQLETVSAQLQKRIIAKEIDGYLIIPQNVLETRRAKYAARSVSNFLEMSQFSSTLSRIGANIRLEKLGISPEKIRKEMDLGRIALDTPKITKQGEVKSRIEVNYIIAYILTFFLYIMLIIYGVMIMRSVLEEKTQRITETIISSIRPFELLAGKIIGISALGITQLLVWGIIILLPLAVGVSFITHFSPDVVELFSNIKLVHISLLTIAFFFFFFVLGFLLYASFFAAVGAIVNSEDEAQQLQIYIMLPIIIQYLIFFTIVQNPESSLAYWTSIIPFFTPILMLARMSVLDPQIPDGLWLSVVLLVVTTYLTIKVTAKIYRIGILMYGKRPSLKEVYKWVKYY